MNGLFCFWPLYRNFPPALPRPNDWQPREGLLGESSSGAVLIEERPRDRLLRDIASECDPLRNQLGCRGLKEVGREMRR